MARDKIKKYSPALVYFHVIVVSVEATDTAGNGVCTYSDELLIRQAVGSRVIAH